jgi:hypothetical protein
MLQPAKIQFEPVTNGWLLSLIVLAYFTNCLYLLNYPRMYQNIKGHGTKQSKFYDSLHYTAFNVVFLTVAWLNALYQHQSLFLRRYTVLRPDRNWSDTACERPMALVSGGMIFSSVRSLLLFVGVFTLNDHSFLPVSGQFSGAANIFLLFFFFCWYYIPAWDLDLLLSLRLRDRKWHKFRSSWWCSRSLCKHFNCM